MIIPLVSKQSTLDMKKPEAAFQMELSLHCSNKPFQQKHHLQKHQMNLEYIEDKRPQLSHQRIVRQRMINTFSAAVTHNSNSITWYPFSISSSADIKKKKKKLLKLWNAKYLSKGIAISHDCFDFHNNCPVLSSAGKLNTKDST